MYFDKLNLFSDLFIFYTFPSVFSEVKIWTAESSIEKQVEFIRKKRIIQITEVMPV